MNCKFCGLDGLHWGENWKKGDRPLEPETNIMHTSQRCQDVQNRNVIKTDGWIKYTCIVCSSLVFASKKHFTKKITTCLDCTKTFLN